MKKKKLILSFSVFIFSSVFIMVGSYIYIQDIIKKPYNIEDTLKREFVIKEGESVGQIAINLEEKRFIAGKDFFKIYVWEEKLVSGLQAGSYELSPSMTIMQIVDIFINGRVRGDEILITIPEGFSNKEIDKRLCVITFGMEQTNT